MVNGDVWSRYASAGLASALFKFTIASLRVRNETGSDAVRDGAPMTVV